LLRQRNPFSKAIPAALLATAAVIVSLLAHDVFSHRHPFDLVTVLAASPVPVSPSITVDYPEEGSIFPPEITPPTFIWSDGGADAKKWLIDIVLDGDSKQIHAVSAGEPIQLGEIDPRTVSISNLPRTPGFPTQKPGRPSSNTPCRAPPELRSPALTLRIARFLKDVRLSPHRWIL
jgi:hypothetical protein